MNSTFWFCGNGFFASECLEQLIAQGCVPSLVITGHPTARGRGKKLTPQPVEEKATELGLTVCRVHRLKDETQLLTRARDEADLLLVVDFGQKIERQWIDAPKYGALNIHPSVLPRWRGAAPVQRALMAGDRTLGVTLFLLAEKMDAGDIVAQYSRERTEEERADKLFAEMALRGVQLFIDCKEKGSAIKAEAKSQDEALATQAHKIDKSERYLDVAVETAEELKNRVTGLSPKPGAWLELEGNRITVIEAASRGGSGTVGSWRLQNEELQIATKEGWLALLRIVPAGKAEMTGAGWANGRRGGK